MTLAFRIVLWATSVDRVYDLPKDVDVVFLGNSHVGRFIVQDKRFKNRTIYVNNSTLIASLWRMSELDRRGALSSVSAVVVTYDTSSLRKHRELSHEDSLIEAPLMFANYNVVPAEYLCRSILPIFWSWHSWILDVSYQEWRKEPSSPEKTFADLPLDKQRAMLQPNRKSNYSFAEHRNMTSNILEQMKVICNRNNIRLILLATPLLSKHRDYPVNGEVDGLLEAFDLAKSIGIEVYDYRTRMNDCDFADPSHLTRRAAWVFTKLFLSEILPDNGNVPR